MGFFTEWNADHLVPRISIANKDEQGNFIVDGYAVGLEATINQDGYVVNNLRPNTIYVLQTRTQAIYYGMLSDGDGRPTKLADMDDTAKLLQLEVGSTSNGHYLGTGVRVNIRATPGCRTLVIKAAVNGAVVNLSPLGSVTDPPDSGNKIVR